MEASKNHRLRVAVPRVLQEDVLRVGHIGRLSGHFAEKDTGKAVLVEKYEAGCWKMVPILFDLSLIDPITTELIRIASNYNQSYITSIVHVFASLQIILAV